MSGGPRDTTAPQPGQVSLYRFYDASEELLYVGVSNEPWRRRKRHSVTQPWYPRVRHQAITWLDSEDAALRAETRAIRAERPAFNVRGAIRPVRARVTLHVGLMQRVLCAWLAGTAVLVVLACMPSVHPALWDAFRISLGAGYAFLGALWLVIGAPRVRRFAAWIERNSVYPGTGASSRHMTHNSSQAADCGYEGAAR